MTKRTTVEAWEQALAFMLKLPPEVRDEDGYRKLEDDCRRIVERVRAGGFSEEVERVLRKGARGFLNGLKVTQMQLSLRPKRNGSSSREGSTDHA
jgi:hypothetical protein